MKFHHIVSLIAFLLILFTVLYGGPRLSSYLHRKYKRSIDKNAIEISAMVYQKKTHKGHLVMFRYVYKSKEYRNREQDNELFEKLSIGDSIRIIIDTTDPSSSYILKDDVKITWQ